MSQNTSQQPTNGNIFANKIVPIINSILTISWKSEPGHKYAWKTFKKSFSGEPLFGSDKWEVSKSDSTGKTAADTLYLIILNGTTVFEAKDPVGNASGRNWDPKKVTVLTFISGDWPRLFFLLRNRVKAGKLKSD